ncbi:hypothetical protein D3C73_1039000 [compost metagenome]
MHILGWRFFNLEYVAKRLKRSVSVILLDQSRLIPSVEVPVYFFLGKYDYSTPFQLVEQYRGMLDVPDKEVVWFDNLAICRNFIMI